MIQRYLYVLFPPSAFKSIALGIWDRGRGCASSSEVVVDVRAVCNLLCNDERATYRP